MGIASCKHSCCKVKVEHPVINLDDTPVTTPKPTQEELTYEWENLLDDLSIVSTPVPTTTTSIIPQQQSWHSIQAEDALSDHGEEWQQFIDQVIKEAEDKASTEISTPENTITLSDDGIDERVPVFNVEDQRRPQNPTRYAFWDSIGDYAYRTLNSQRYPDTTTSFTNPSTSSSSSRLVPLPTITSSMMIDTNKHDDTTYQQQQQASKQKNNHSLSMRTWLDENTTIVPSTQPHE